MAGKVTCIPATKNRFTALPVTSVSKRRVAAYARVSTDSDEQFTSYAAQIDYYTNYIQQHPEWEFVKVYTDEGISGLNTRHRDGFNEMIADALAGKIDLIVTKSVSRFARNTVDSLTTIRKLKEHGVECYFEKESIYTFDGKGELLLTIMSSLAQEESRSISESVDKINEAPFHIERTAIVKQIDPDRLALFSGDTLIFHVPEQDLLFPFQRVIVHRDIKLDAAILCEFIKIDDCQIRQLGIERIVQHIKEDVTDFSFFS